MAKKGKVRIDIYDVIGKRLGKLTVIGYHHCTYDNTKGGQRMRHYYLCRCDCGTIKVVQRGQITSEIICSCGCSRRLHDGD